MLRWIDDHNVIILNTELHILVANSPPNKAGFIATRLTATILPMLLVISKSFCLYSELKSAIVYCDGDTYDVLNVKPGSEVCSRKSNNIDEKAELAQRNCTKYRYVIEGRKLWIIGRGGKLNTTIALYFLLPTANCWTLD